MTHHDFKTGMAVQLRPHTDYPWETWKVGQLLPLVVELLRDISRDEAVSLYGEAALPPDIQGVSKTEFDLRLLAIRLPNGELTDEAGHHIEMREAAN